MLMIDQQEFVQIVYDPSGGFTPLFPNPTSFQMIFGPTFGISMENEILQSISPIDFTDITDLNYWTPTTDNYDEEIMLIEKEFQIIKQKLEKHYGESKGKIDRKITNKLFFLQHQQIEDEFDQTIEKLVLKFNKQIDIIKEFYKIQ
jgi:hypothetical protein